MGTHQSADRLCEVWGRGLSKGDWRLKTSCCYGTWDVRSLLRAQRAMVSVAQMGVVQLKACVVYKESVCHLDPHFMEADTQQAVIDREGCQ